MKIIRAESFMLKVPIRREIADGMQATNVLEFVGVNVSTDEGITGTGYTITVGAGGSVIKEVLDSLFVDQLTGKDPFNVKEVWKITLDWTLLISGTQSEPALLLTNHYMLWYPAWIPSLSV